MDTFCCPLCGVEVLYADKRAHSCATQTSETSETSSSTCGVLGCTNPEEANGLCGHHLDVMASCYAVK